MEPHLVHLVHIGWAKAGSSVLQDWFGSHPQIAYARGGLLGVRSAFDLANGTLADPAAIRLRVTSEESLSTPHATAGEDIIGQLKAGAHVADPPPEQVCSHLEHLFPNAFILIITRAFREVIFSSYSQAVKQGSMHFFEDWAPDLGGTSHLPSSKWDYDRIIARYEAAFPGRVIVLPYELLRDSPEEFLRVLEREFGLDHVPLTTRFVNKSLSATELAWYPLFTRLVRYAPLPERLKRRMMRSYFSAVSTSKLKGFAEACQRIYPRQLPNANMIGDAVLARFASQAQSLGARPFYQKYLRGYLLEP